MIPESISATALGVAINCLARFEAEHVIKGKGAQGQAAAEGSVVHNALESFVQMVFLDQTHEWGWDLLKDLYKISYLALFGSLDEKDQKFKDGVDMIAKWFARGDLKLPDRTVVSVEQKLFFPVNIGGAKVPFNYIIDRLDKFGESDVYKIVDYKTNRWGLNPEDLRKKPQARAYALALQIQNPDLEGVWVEFDMLRHNGPVGTYFTKQDNRETREIFRSQFQRIGDTPAGQAPETLNPECHWCVRKTECNALQRNIKAGGTYSLSTTEAIELRAKMEWQRNGVAAAIKELDERILLEAQQQDATALTTGTIVAEVAVSTRRTLDPEMAEKVLGTTLWGKYGSKTVSMTTVDNLLKGNEISDAQKSQLRQLIYSKMGEPRIKTRQA